VIGFTDADHAGNLDDRGYTSGCVFLCHVGSNSWFSRKKNCTSLSTTEADFVAGQSQRSYLDEGVPQRDTEERIRSNPALLRQSRGYSCEREGERAELPHEEKEIKLSFQSPIPPLKLISSYPTVIQISILNLNEAKEGKN
jgi:hypothetical protein